VPFRSSDCLEERERTEPRVFVCSPGGGGGKKKKNSISTFTYGGNIATTWQEKEDGGENSAGEYSKGKENGPVNDANPRGEGTVNWGLQFLKRKKKPSLPLIVAPGRKEGKRPDVPRAEQKDPFSRTLKKKGGSMNTSDTAVRKEKKGKGVLSDFLGQGGHSYCLR